VPDLERLKLRTTLLATPAAALLVVVLSLLAVHGLKIPTVR
jgi:hypothetical protein